MQSVEHKKPLGLCDSAGYLTPAENTAETLDTNIGRPSASRSNTSQVNPTCDTSSQVVIGSGEDQGYDYIDETQLQVDISNACTYMTRGNGLQTEVEGRISRVKNFLRKRKQSLTMVLLTLFICGAIYVFIFKGGKSAPTWTVTSSTNSSTTAQPTTSIRRTDVEACRIMGDQVDHMEPDGSARRVFVEKVLVKALSTSPQYNIMFGLTKTIGIGQGLLDTFVDEIMTMLENVFESAKHGYIDPKYFKNFELKYIVNFQITPGQPMMDDFTKQYFILAAMTWDNIDESAHRQCLVFIKRSLHPDFNV